MTTMMMMIVLNYTHNSCHTSEPIMACIRRLVHHARSSENSTHTCSCHLISQQKVTSPVRYWLLHTIMCHHTPVKYYRLTAQHLWDCFMS